MQIKEYDLVVIGSGPAGQKGAICASKLGKSAAVVDKKLAIGGVCVNTGTIPSKTLREAILYFSGFRQRLFYGRNYMLKDNISMQDLLFRAQAVRTREVDVIKSQLRRNGITTYEGEGHFVDANTVEVQSEMDPIQLRGKNILIASGTRPAHSENFPIDGQQIFDSDQVESLAEIPRDLIVVGAGVIGMEYAAMFAALGVKVILVEQRPAVLEFVDREIVDNLCFQMRRMGAIFRLEEKVVEAGIEQDRHRVFIRLESGKVLHGQTVLYAVGRQANTDGLNLNAVGIESGSRGKLTVNEHFQTTTPNIYAAGDVIGFPSLASTSMEQGRLAANHMFGMNGTRNDTVIPYGIYTIPEVSMVGQTEEQLTHAKIPYEVGIARYAELAKGQMLGDEEGLLKILFHPETLRILGVHAIGERAAEIIHIGQAVLALGGTVEYFRDTVFNYPTLAEAYKVAALDGLNKL
jgi:NAD(P) transhydrogenase